MSKVIFNVLQFVGVLVGIGFLWSGLTMAGNVLLCLVYLSVIADTLKNKHHKSMVPWMLGASFLLFHSTPGMSFIGVLCLCYAFMWANSDINKGIVK